MYANTKLSICKQSKRIAHKTILYLWHPFPKKHTCSIIHLRNSMEVQKKLLFSEGEFDISFERPVGNDAINLLKANSIGNQGPVYRHLDTEEHVKNLVNPTLISLRKKDSLVGMGVFCNLEVKVDNNPYNCFYIRYFSAAPEIRGQGFMKKFGLRAMSLIRNGQHGKTIFYASVEAHNKSSLNVVEEAGYEPIRKIKTLGISRFFPKQSNKIRSAQTPDEQKRILQSLSDFYGKHSMVQFTKIFHLNDYYFIEEDGQLVAGCQIHRVHWIIKKLGGITGKAIVALSPYIPLIRKIFNAKKFNFLALEGIYFVAGKEKRFLELVEGLLAMHGFNTALAWFDKECPSYHAICKNGNLGLVNLFTRKADTYLMASFVDMDADEIQKVKNCPVYISSYDFT